MVVDFSNQGFYVGIHIFLQDTDGISRIIATDAKRKNGAQKRTNPGGSVLRPENLIVLYRLIL